MTLWPKSAITTPVVERIECQPVFLGARTVAFYLVLIGVTCKLYDACMTCTPFVLCLVSCIRPVLCLSHASLLSSALTLYFVPGTRLCTETACIQARSAFLLSYVCRMHPFCLLPFRMVEQTVDADRLREVMQRAEARCVAPIRQTHHRSPLDDL